MCVQDFQSRWSTLQAELAAEAQERAVVQHKLAASQQRVRCCAAALRGAVAGRAGQPSAVQCSAGCAQWFGGGGYAVARWWRSLLLTVCSVLCRSAVLTFLTSAVLVPLYGLWPPVCPPPPCR